MRPTRPSPWEGGDTLVNAAEGQDEHQGRPPAAPYRSAGTPEREGCQEQVSLYQRAKSHSVEGPAVPVSMGGFGQVNAGCREVGGRTWNPGRAG